jgi:hypothetical protein
MAPTCYGGPRRVARQRPRRLHPTPADPDIMTFDEACQDVRRWLSLKMVTGRCSSVLVQQLAACLVTRTAHVHRIYDVLGQLDRFGRVPGTKDATQFTHSASPLRGLWHQHWFEPQFLRQNLIVDLRSEKVAPLLTDMADAINRGDDISRFAYDLVIGRFWARNKACEMTGEWIIFAKVESINCFLTLACHREGKNRREGEYRIFERVRQCELEFPEIASCIEGLA